MVPCFLPEPIRSDVGILRVPEEAQGQRIKAVAFVRIVEIGGQQRVSQQAAGLEAERAEDMEVELQVMADQRDRGVGQHGRQPCRHAGPRQVRALHVRQRQVVRDPGLPPQPEADDGVPARIEPHGLGVEDQRASRPSPPAEDPSSSSSDETTR